MSAKRTNASGDSHTVAPDSLSHGCPAPRRTGLYWLVAVAIVVALLMAGAAAGQAPRAAVARIVVQEQGGVAYGSGALIDARGEFGLVVTNWHVVREASGPIEVIFPSGFRSEARSLKLDEDWDLAALVIWRPPATPLPLATTAPRPGDRLTICGYGSGQYREATGRCTEYYAPEIGLPQELVELSVEARQGDSGGPILNDAGQVAGVLFGAGQGTTLGSFGGRVGTFLASLAPGIGAPRAAPALELETPAASQPSLVAVNAGITAPQIPATAAAPIATPPWRRGEPFSSRENEAGVALVDSNSASRRTLGRDDSFAPWEDRSADQSEAADASTTEIASTTVESVEATPTAPIVTAVSSDVYAGPPPGWFDDAKSIFAVVGLIFVLLQLVRLVT